MPCPPSPCPSSSGSSLHQSARLAAKRESRSVSLPLVVSNGSGRQDDPFIVTDDFGLERGDAGHSPVPEQPGGSGEHDQDNEDLDLAVL
jgi:hypothetical protein